MILYSSSVCVVFFSPSCWMSVVFGFVWIFYAKLDNVVERSEFMLAALMLAYPSTSVLR